MDIKFGLWQHHLPSKSCNIHDLYSLKYVYFIDLGRRIEKLASVTSQEQSYPTIYHPDLAISINFENVWPRL